MEVGSLAEWVGAILTGAALIVAAVALSRELIDRRQAAARLVHVTYREPNLLIHNGASTPIRDLEIDVRDLILDAIPGGAVRAWAILEDVQAGERLEVPAEHDGDPFFSVPRQTAYALEFRFTDADGRHWRRDWRGKLHSGRH